MLVMSGTIIVAKAQSGVRKTVVSEVAQYAEWRGALDIGQHHSCPERMK
jgi:hypothetical protein